MKKNFRVKVSAHIINRLGKELIPNNGVGLSVLIKNSYDADATEVKVILTGAFKDPKESNIVLQDNGHGMDVEDLENKFFDIATEHKRGKKTAMGRSVLGEKGIGRFAVQRMAHKLTIHTKKIDGDEWKVEVDWDEFDRHGEKGKEVGDIAMIGTNEHEEKHFQSGESGTVLVIRELREKFDGNSMKKVKRTVGHLVSPFTEVTDFDLSVLVPSEYQNHDFMKFSPEVITKRAHFTFRSRLDGDGTIDYEYACNQPWSPNNGETKNGVWTVQELLDREIGIRDVSINLYAYQRVQGLLDATGISKPQLDELVGVRLYRDGMRVWPYGDIRSKKKGKKEIDDSLLRLTNSRMQATDKWVGHDQVIAAIDIDQKSNPELRDKTDRSGMVENKEFEDLVEICRAVISKFAVTFFHKHKRTTRPTPPWQKGTSQAKLVGRSPNVEQKTEEKGSQLKEVKTRVVEGYHNKFESTHALPENLKKAKKKVGEASQSLSNIMSTLQLDEKYMQEAISLAQSHLEEAKKELSD